MSRRRRNETDEQRARRELISAKIQIRPTAFTIGLIIHFSIAQFCVYTELWGE